ncbi:hypothetical protein SAY86_013261 [Trapa natans]|uniref:Uncharacterized protein n=1 Tax=Trapa natans TaxID=22666 RepID=A0AAN7LZG3_TRANT|nr:hypothetical protein SAY86_013261 [Trapa natans]
MSKASVNRLQIEYWEVSLLPITSTDLEVEVDGGGSVREEDPRGGHCLPCLPGVQLFGLTMPYIVRATRPPKFLCVSGKAAAFMSEMGGFEGWMAAILVFWSCAKFDQDGNLMDMLMPTRDGSIPLMVPASCFIHNIMH